MFRVGDDEFAVLLTDEPYKERDYLLKRARNAFYAMEGNQVLLLWERCSAALGVAEYDPGKDTSFEMVYNRAEENLYQEKAKLKGEAGTL